MEKLKALIKASSKVPTTAHLSQHLALIDGVNDFEAFLESMLEEYSFEDFWDIPPTLLVTSDKERDLFKRLELEIDDEDLYGILTLTLAHFIDIVVNKLHISS